MKKSALLGSVAVLAGVIASAAFAGEAGTPSINPAAALPSYSTGNDRSQFSLSPNYSEELGWSLKGTAGSYLSDDMAIGLIVEYGANKREYLANAGVQLSDSYSFIGTVGMLEEHNEFVDGEDREKVQQMEYGVSLKGTRELGLISGVELNAYLADADTDSDSLEAGKLYGVQLLHNMDLTGSTRLQIGGGHEWLKWDNTEGDNDSFAFSAEAVQKLGDQLSLSGRYKLGASEKTYRGGLSFDLSDEGMNTNTLGVTYGFIEGRNGIEDDTRVELTWSYGFGARPSATAANTSDTGATSNAAAAAVAGNLLSDVMKRPAYLPERVLARSGGSCLLTDGYTSFIGQSQITVFFPTGVEPTATVSLGSDTLPYNEGASAPYNDDLFAALYSASSLYLSGTLNLSIPGYRPCIVPHTNSIQF